jgi:hypothetical protein
MVSPRLSDSCDCEQSLDDGSGTPIALYLETITILQDEVARLEHVLQMQDERQRETSSNDEASFQEDAGVGGSPENFVGEPEDVERFKSELASRDETIGLLLDELSRLEEAQAATRAEWEHLSGWVAELEHRVEGQDRDALDQLENRLAGQQQNVDALQVKSEQDRRAWEAKRQIDQQEIARLQRTLDQLASSSETAGGRVAHGSGSDGQVVEALQAENRRLQAACQKLVERTAAADRCEALDAKLALALDGQHQLRRQLEQIQDERKRERLEYEAKMAELQARLSDALLIQPVAPPPANAPAGVPPERDAELRVRALRQHLLEVDQREKEERRQKQLVNRLSRLWSRTGPR